MRYQSKNFVTKRKQTGKSSRFGKLLVAPETQFTAKTQHVELQLKFQYRILSFFFNAAKAVEQIACDNNFKVRFNVYDSHR